MKSRIVVLHESEWNTMHKCVACGELGHVPGTFETCTGLCKKCGKNSGKTLKAVGRWRRFKKQVRRKRPKWMRRLGFSKWGWWRDENTGWDCEEMKDEG